MTVSQLIQELNLEVINSADLDREVVGAYAGDLLSWVMTRLDSDNAYITIMNNVNVIAVASLSDAACVILTENAEVSCEIIDKAKNQNINLLRSEKTTFETSFLIGRMLYDK
ncbi:MAG: AraC family transcriptional regulator [Ruminococcaceae bacterium]|nr:AraC family transcriptional regulator [Oscillospiraceae bacterium]